MGIDWFTFSAQLINFVILIVLLQRFLYQPILRAMNQRKQRIQAALTEAEEKGLEAEKAAQKYQEQRQAFAAQRQVQWEAALEEIDREKNTLAQQAKAEVNQARSQWYEALEQEKQVFFEQLRQRTGAEMARVLRQACGELAGISLETQMIQVFSDRLQNLPPEEKQALGADLNPDTDNCFVRSAFPLNEAQRHQLQRLITQEISPQARIMWQEIPELICGIQLVASGQELSWSLGRYLDDFEDQLTVTLKN